MSRSEAFQVGPGVAVTLRYQVFDAEGELVGGSEGAKVFLIGEGDLLPALEQALLGALPGDRRSIRLRAKEAFGDRDPKAVAEIDRADFPDDVAAGDRYEAVGEDGTPVVLRVLEVFDDHVVIDRNHPLAGQALRVDVEILSTRPATKGEFAAAADPRRGQSVSAEPPLILAERLLRGPSRR